MHGYNYIEGQKYDDISTQALLVRLHISKERSHTEMAAQI